MLHLRARWYAPETGTFLSRDPVESEPPYLYVRGNPVSFVDPSGFCPRGQNCYGPGFIEERINASVWSLNPIQGSASDAWLLQAIRDNAHPVVRKTYLSIRERLINNEFVNGTVRNLYRETRMLAEDELSGSTCSTMHEWQESAHVALIVLAGIGRADEDAGAGGPGFIRNPDGLTERDKQGPDTGWHFFYHSFLSFEYLYSNKYGLSEYDELRNNIWTATKLTRGKAQAVEYKYQDLTGDIYDDSFNQIDIDAYYTAVYAGNFYEVVSTYDNATRKDAGECRNLIHFAPIGVVEIPFSGKTYCRLLAMTDSLENFKKLMEQQNSGYSSGVRDPGVFTRDIRANHLGAKFGIDAFYFSNALPPVP